MANQLSRALGFVRGRRCRMAQRVAYQVGDISLGKAAELMGVSAEEMKELLLRAGIPIHLGPASADELREELSAFERG
ncbi:MAG: UPF0175 family protein [Chloroflexi bacterium]|nr:UPF0175 family protein [Chloroflexota bacterium]